jgi:hypothetical protein
MADKLMGGIRWAVVKRYTTLDTVVLCSGVLALSRSFWEGTFIIVVGTILAKYIERGVGHG